MVEYVCIYVFTLQMVEYVCMYVLYRWSSMYVLYTWSSMCVCMYVCMYFTHGLVCMYVCTVHMAGLYAWCTEEEVPLPSFSQALTYSPVGTRPEHEPIYLGMHCTH